jgi:16S rRNA processing protein RimM
MALIDRDRLTCIGRIVDAHGLRGEVKVLPLTREHEFYRNLRAAVLDTPQGLRAVEIEALRPGVRHWVVRLAGIADRTAAQELRGAGLWVEAAQLKPLAPGEVFAHDLVGCLVQTLDGRTIGPVRAVLETGANDVLAVDGGSGEVLVPLVDDVVREVDLGRRVIRIDPPPGLLPEAPWPAPGGAP